MCLLSSDGQYPTAAPAAGFTLPLAFVPFLIRQHPSPWPRGNLQVHACSWFWLSSEARTDFLGFCVEVFFS